MLDATAIDRIDKIKTRIDEHDKVSLSDFSRDRTWKSKLAEADYLELLEHGKRTAWVVSNEGMRNLVGYISELEEAEDRAYMESLAREREGREEWKTGDDLRAAIAGHREAGE